MFSILKMDTFHVILGLSNFLSYAVAFFMAIYISVQLFIFKTATYMVEIQ
jgi:hypothetical protein